MRRRFALLGLSLIALATLAACAVYFGNARPIASFIAMPESGSTPLTVDFDASASHDPDGAIDAYIWDFGDGQTASSIVTPTHIFVTVQTTPEAFVVTLTVTDNEGSQGSATRTITVNP